MGRVLTEMEAIDYLGLDRIGLRQPREALRWLRRTGRLRAARIGRHIFYTERWLDEFLERSEITPAGDEQCLSENIDLTPRGDHVGRQETRITTSSDRPTST